MWYLLLYLATFYATRACAHILGDPEHFSPYFYDKYVVPLRGPRVVADTTLAEFAETNSAYVAHLWLVRTNGVCGALDLLLGPRPRSGRVRSNWPRWHRLLGKLYFVALVPAAVTGLALSAIAYGGPAQSALVFLSLAWSFSGWRAYRTIRGGDVSSHRVWMFRHYALTLAAVSLRVQTAWRLGLGEEFPAIYAQCAWLSWARNLVLAECWVRRKLFTTWIRW